MRKREREKIVKQKGRTEIVRGEKEREKENRPAKRENCKSRRARTRWQRGGSIAAAFLWF